MFDVLFYSKFYRDGYKATFKLLGILSLESGDASNNNEWDAPNTPPPLWKWFDHLIECWQSTDWVSVNVFSMKYISIRTSERLDQKWIETQVTLQRSKRKFIFRKLFWIWGSNISWHSSNIFFIIYMFPQFRETKDHNQWVSRSLVIEN